MLAFVAVSLGANAQNIFTNLASEYAIAGSLPGDQIGSQVSFNSQGGWIVWQDNATDGDGMGISARRLESSLSGGFGNFRVNQIGMGEQQKPQVALLKNGGAVFAWQGGQNFADIYARFMDANGAFVTGDVLINTFTNRDQSAPSIACLSDGNVAVTWESYGQDGSMLGIFGQLLSPNGLAIGAEFAVNQITNYNQRNPSVAALANGGFVVTWATELRQSPDASSQFKVEIHGRVFSGAGVPGDEFSISSPAGLSANSAAAGTSDGGFTVAWSQKSTNPSNSWDVAFRSFDGNGVAGNSAVIANEFTYGDQFAPKIAASGTNLFIVWTSLGQDGSNEGVYGRNFGSNGAPAGNEQLINTKVSGGQIQPSTSADETGRFLVVWSSFVGGLTSLDLSAQRFAIGAIAESLVAPSAPYVSAVNQNELSVSWPELAGYAVLFYELYVDAAPSPLVVSGIHTNLGNFLPNSSHAFRLLYQLTDGRRSPLSSVASATTWGLDGNVDGLPDDWEALQWGTNSTAWPNVGVDSDGDGASNSAEFYAGTDPSDRGSVLRTRMTKTSHGIIFVWNTQPSLVYQVQKTVDLGSWQDFGAPRFAHGIIDSVAIGSAGQGTFYRVVRLR